MIIRNICRRGLWNKCKANGLFGKWCGFSLSINHITQWLKATFRGQEVELINKPVKDKNEITKTITSSKDKSNPFNHDENITINLNPDGGGFTILTIPRDSAQSLKAHLSVKHQPDLVVEEGEIVEGDSMTPPTLISIPDLTQGVEAPPCFSGSKPEYLKPITKEVKDTSNPLLKCLKMDASLPGFSQVVNKACDLTEINASPSNMGLK
ncbi:hypothetical protein SUGI_0195680 [Cryptomeria japonica]|nr:hypothetical protein SUGI_0195680 [Cryptomeria japonica]